MASMVGNPTGSVGEPGGIRAAAMAKAAGRGGPGLGPGIKGEYNPLRAKAEAREDLRQQREVQNKKTFESRAAEKGRAHRPGYRGNNPQNPTILT